MGNNTSKTSSDVSSTTSDTHSSTQSATSATTTLTHSSKTTSASAKSTTTMSTKSSSSSSSDRHRSSTSSSTSHTTKSTTIASSSGASTGIVITTSIPLSSTTITLISTSGQSTLFTTSTSTSYAVAAASTTATVASASSHHSGISPGALAAAVVIPIVVLLGLLGFFFICLRRRRTQRTYPRLQSPVLSGTTSREAPVTPSADDTEKMYEKDMELTPIQRSAPANAFAPSASQSIPMRSLAVAPPTPSSQTYTLPSRDVPSSSSSSPDFTFKSSPRPLSGSTLLPPVLPEMDTGHFFDSSRGSTPQPTHNPFSDPQPGYTPSPIDRYHEFSGTRNAPIDSSPTPVTYNTYSATQTTAPSTSTPTPAKPILQTRRYNHLQIPTGVATPQGPRTPGVESDHFSMMSDGEDDEADADMGIVEYATAARVATVAQVVGGPATSGHEQPLRNRQSVGLVTLGPVPGGSRSRPTSPATSSTASPATP